MWRGRTCYFCSHEDEGSQQLLVILNENDMWHLIVWSLLALTFGTEWFKSVTFKLYQISHICEPALKHPRRLEDERGSVKNPEEFAALLTGTIGNHEARE